MKNDLEKLHGIIRSFEDMRSILDKVFCGGDSHLYSLFYDLITMQTISIEIRYGIDAEWLDWFINEDDFGRKKLNVFLDKKKIRIRCIDDFVNFMNEINSLRGTDRVVEWVEPYHTGIRKSQVSINTAVQTQRAVAEKKGFEYKNDSEALDDFMTIRWGKIINKKHEQV